MAEDSLGDGGTGTAGDAVLGLFQQRDESGAAGLGLGELYRGLDDWELEGARSTLLNAYASMGDSQGKLENFYLGQAATGNCETPEDLAAQVRDVTEERIRDAMESVTLDTVYFLTGKEQAE